MKLEDIHNEILTELSKYTKLDPASLMYSKNKNNGDLMIHSSKIQNDNIVNSILEKFVSKNIVKVSFTNNIINFFVDKKKISKEIIKTIFKENENFGIHADKNELFVVEFSSPNIAKRFHPGHFRNTVLGNFINNLVKANGYKTHTINYLGDWGKQFGIIGVGFEKYGSEEKMQQDPIKHLYEIYVKINNDIKNDPKIDEEAKGWFTDLENGKEENYKMWKRCRDMSVEKYKKLYQTMNCSFDEYSGESFYANKGKEIIVKIEEKQKANFEAYKKQNDDTTNFDEKENKIEQGLKNLNISNNDTNNNLINNDLNNIVENITDDKNKKKFFENILKSDQNDNSKYIETKYGKICVIKNDGSTLYSTRDIAAAIDRLERLKPSQMLYVVASQQDLYFQQLFDVFKMIGYGMKEDKFICKHINYGMVNGMSTRKGTVVFLEDILCEAKEVMLQKMKNNMEKFNQIKDVDNTCLILALSALVIQDFSSKRIKNYDFNMERNTGTTGFTGPYLQYLHCRLVSLEDKNSELTDKYMKSTEDLLINFDKEFISDFFYENVCEVIYFLSKYPYTIQRCMDNYEPSTMITYLMDLCKMVSSIIGDLKVLGVEEKLGLSRLYFYKAVRIVLCNGIKLLGLTPLERM
ncbi:arginyl-tRNA synthetase [Gurleya vavrai]